MRTRDRGAGEAGRPGLLLETAESSDRPENTHVKGGTDHSSLNMVDTGHDLRRLRGCQNRYFFSVENETAALLISLGLTQTFEPRFHCRGTRTGTFKLAIQLHF